MKVDEENPNKDESIPLLPDQNDANDNLNEGNFTAYSRDEELESNLTFEESECGIDNLIEKESQFEKDVFEEWQNEDKMFVTTKASKEVGKMIKHKQLVIVAGHSGYGKTAIVHHIALRYRRNGWLIKPVDTVKEIKESYESDNFIKNKTMFVLNDPIGKEALSEVLYTEWKKYEQTLTRFLTSVKIVLTCRKCIVFDKRVKGLFENRSNIVVIDDHQNKLSESEKRQILQNYTNCKGNSDETTTKILQVEAYFPLLCKLSVSSGKHSIGNTCFFTEPIKFFRREIEIYRESDILKYCGLVCLVLFNNNLCKEDLIKTEGIFKKCLNLCGVRESLPPGEIIQNLELLEGFFVKKICDTFQFSHDFILEITTFVFGTDYPREIIKHADIGFLQRRVKLEYNRESTDQLTIIINKTHIVDLVTRLSEEICKDRFIEVVLNPCLRDGKVTDLFIKNMKSDSLRKIVKQTKLKRTEFETYSPTKENFFSRLDFLFLFDEVSPLFALIVFRHDTLVRFFLKALKEDLSSDVYFSAICCNGAMDFYTMFRGKKVSKFLKENKSVFHPIHIATVFHNHELLRELIKRGGNVNLELNTKDAWTPLILAISNDTEQVLEESSFSRQYETVNILLRSSALVNMCNNGYSPLYFACKRETEKIVQLLLKNGAEVNLCNTKGFSPLHIACGNGNECIVKQLLNNGAQVNLCDKREMSPLHFACLYGHDSIVALLLNNGAMVNLLCKDKGISPLHIACKNGHDSIVRQLLNNGADVNLCEKNGMRPLHFASFIGHTSIVHLLLNHNAGVNLLTERGLSPLHLACANGHDSTVQQLLNNGANVNLCDKGGFSPLVYTCKFGHDNLAKKLVNNKAKVNLCDNEGLSPLFLACKNGHNNIVQLLLNTGAEVNSYNKEGPFPLHIACANGHDSVVQQLINKSADVNLDNKEGFSPLHFACAYGHESIVQQLINNKVQINFCSKEGYSPLHVACRNGHDSIVLQLIKNSADVNLCSNDGCSPIFFCL
nr:uncharacterized protein LOC111108482 isoform X2 [Crassostrea virginica]